MFSYLKYRFFQNTTQLQKRYLLVALCTFCISSKIAAQPWTIYFYSETQNSPNDVQQLVANMEKTIALRGTDITVLCDIHDGRLVYRYTMSAGQSTTVQMLREELPQLVVKSGCYELFHTQPEGASMIILSGHGTGILIPTFNTDTQNWQYEPDRDASPCMQYIQDQQINFQRQLFATAFANEDTKKSGGSWVTHVTLTECMEYATQILGRKIDILGLDSCNMAMIEFAYELQQSVSTLIASQECEESDGWEYDELFKALNESSVEATARSLVYSYERIQSRKGRERYSLSAIDIEVLSHVTSTFSSLHDQLVTTISHRDDLLMILCKVRMKLYPLSGPSGYVDLLEFLELLNLELASVYRTPEIDVIVQQLLEARYFLKRSVIASASHASLGGVAVYFPYTHIDSSYTCGYANDTSWRNLLKAFTVGC